MCQNSTVEPRFNDPDFNEIPFLTNVFASPAKSPISVMLFKPAFYESRVNKKPVFNKNIFPKFAIVQHLLRS